MSGEILEQIVSLDPFRVQRAVKWSECDPAGVVYAPNYYVYTLWAYDLFRLRRLGAAASELRIPVKAAALVHHGVLKPGEDFDMLVRPGEVGTTTFGIQVRGSSGGRAIFDADLTLICTSPAEWRAVPVPDEIRARLDGRMSFAPSI